MKKYFPSLLELAIFVLPIPASIIINRYLGPYDRGILAAIILVPSMIASILSFNWDNILKNKVVHLGRDALSPILSTTVYFFSLQVVAGQVVVLLVYYFYNLGEYQYLAILLGSIAIPLQLLYNYLNSLAVCLVENIRYYLLRISGLLFFVIATLTLVYLDGLSISSALFLNQTISLSLIILFLFFLYPILNFSGVEFKLFHKIKFSHHFIGNTLNVLSANIDLLFFLFIGNNALTGAYVTFKILDVPFKSLSLGYFNYLTRSLDWSDIAKIRKSFSGIFFIYLLLVITYFLFIPYIEDVVVFIFGGAFGEFLFLLPYMLLYLATNTFSDYISSNILLAYPADFYARYLLILSLIKVLLAILASAFLDVQLFLISLAIIHITASLIGGYYIFFKEPLSE